MKKYILLMAVLFSSYGILNAQMLKEGDHVQKFNVKASLDGKEMDFSLEEALKNGPLVLYFFPSAYTQGCDIEAHSFSEASDDFKKAGVQILGMSANSIERLNEFSADPDFCAGKFPVASDPKGEVAKSFGLEFFPPKAGTLDNRGNRIDHGFIPRVTFIIDTDGKILKVLSSQEDGISPAEHVVESLQFVKTL